MSARKGVSCADRGSTESTTESGRQSESSFSSLDSSGGVFSGDADGDVDDGVEDDGGEGAEEILRVDKEIENKARINKNLPSSLVAFTKA